VAMIGFMSLLPHATENFQSSPLSDVSLISECHLVF
jgi:hypothetical protein